MWVHALYTTAFQRLCNAETSLCLQIWFVNLIDCWSQVYLPMDALQALIVSSVGDVTILPGFATPALTVSSGFGYGDVYALGFDTQNLVTEISG
jgi:hypothetical protein